jgi:two-component system CheB/CheR fusion protein
VSTEPETPDPTLPPVDQPALPFFVVCVGASAGGLDALERFFSSIPGDSGLAFIVAQHLSPDFRSMMPELLARKTKVPVRSAEDGMPIEPDHIYLLPPRQEVRAESGKLVLTERSTREGLHLPIDTLFHSVGEMQRDLSVGVVLSGSGTDGSRGVSTIKASGGLVLVQSPETAKFDGMPRSAVKAANVDFVADPAHLAERLLLLQSRAVSADATPPELEASEQLTDYQRLFEILERRSGLDFGLYKLGTLARRLHRRMVLTGCDNLSDLADLAEKTSKLADNLLDDLLIKVTRFMRDPDAFLQLQRQVVEPLIRQRQGGSVNEPIRVWVPACATGEEAFSVAILFHEAARRMDARLRLKVFATDADPGAIRLASQASFSAAAIADLQPELVERYFDRDGDRSVVRRSLRDSVTFAIHNVLVDPPFTRLDLVCCRNMLIYLKPEVQNRVLDRLAFSLVEGGCLFLGASETLSSNQSELFESLTHRWKVYRLKNRPRRPVLQPIASGAATLGAAPVDPEDHRRPRTLVGEALADHILKAVSPPGFVVGPNYELRYVFGDVSPYMKVAHGTPRSSALPMLRPPLSVLVTSAVRKAADEEKQQRVAGVRIQDGTESDLFDVVVTPLSTVSRTSEDFVVHFEVGPRTLAQGAGPTLAPDDASQLRIQELERELALTRDHLQSAVHELEAYNEELQTTNEELLASNEELQATNEELQSVNEELYTVNTEHQRKLDELERMTGDLTGVLAATDAGVLLLDGLLNVRRFNRAVTRIFPLTRMDEGRPISDFKMRVRYPELIDDLNRVLSDGRPVHRDVQATETWWRFDLRPTEAGSQEPGVVVTAQDQTNVAQRSDEGESLAQAMSAAADSLGVGTFVVDASGTVVFGGAASRYLDLPADATYDLEAALRQLAEDPTTDLMPQVLRLMEATPESEPKAVRTVCTPPGNGVQLELRLTNWKEPRTSRIFVTGAFHPAGAAPVDG